MGDLIVQRVANIEERVGGHGHRLDTLEKTTTDHSKQYVDLRIEMTRVDEMLKGIREQARVHSEAQTKAINEMMVLFKSDTVRLETFFSKIADEQQKVMDKVISALGIDEDIHAASSLRKNLQRLADGNSNKDRDFRTIRNWIIVFVLGVGAFLGATGVKRFVENPYAEAHDANER